MTDEERNRMQSVWKTKATKEEGTSSEKYQLRLTGDEGHLVGMESSMEHRSSGLPAPRNMDLLPPIVPVIKPSDHEAIQNRNEELSDDERARARQQTGPFPGPHQVDPSCSCWDCVRFLPGGRD